MRHLLALPMLLAATVLDAKIVEVSLNDLVIAVDEDTGSIVSLGSPHTGPMLATQAASAGLLDVAYPVDSFAAMRLASRFSKAAVVSEGKRVTITWQRLGASRSNLALPDGGVRAQVIIQAADDGRSVILRSRIENNSAAPVRQILFPDLWGLRPFAGVRDTRLRLARGVIAPFDEPFKAAGTTPFYTGPSAAQTWKQYPSGELTSERRNTLRWLDFGGFQGGLSVFQKKWGTTDWPNILTHRTEADPMSLRIVWEHKQAIEPGQSWDSGEFWLTPHPGGWAKGIEAYRDYVTQINPPRPIPAHVKEDIGFQTIWMIQSVETDPAKAAFRYQDLPRVAEDARRYGIHEVVAWGSHSYSVLPIPIRPELGSEAELLEGVRKAREIGVNIAPFISVGIVLNRYVERYGVQPDNNDWTYHYEFVPQIQPYYSQVWSGTEIDGNNKLWQADVLDSLSRWIDRGVTSFSWDTFKVHAGPPGTRPPLLSIAEALRKRARAANPQSTMSGESNTHLEIDGPALDYLWIWNDYMDAAPITNVLTVPRMSCNVEDSALTVAKCFADNLYINAMPRKLDSPNGTALISEQPELAASLLRTTALRKQFLPFFRDGTLIGDSVLALPTSAFVRGYQLGDRMLIIVLNDQTQAQRVGVQSDLSLWLPQRPQYETTAYDTVGRAVATTASTGSHWFGSTGQLEPGQMAFFVIGSKPGKP